MFLEHFEFSEIFGFFFGNFGLILSKFLICIGNLEFGSEFFFFGILAFFGNSFVIFLLFWTF